MQKRNDTLDAIKGVCALLVVLGHCVQYYYQTSYTQVYAFNFIYAFHMPFFMMLAGISMGYSKCDNTWMKRRVVRLLIPFFVWVVIKFFLTSPLENYTIPGMVMGVLHSLWNAVMNPTGGLWFLYILCAESVLIWLLRKSAHCRKLTVLLIGICVVAMLSGWREYRFGIKYMVQYFPFVAGGWLLHGGEGIHKLCNFLQSRRLYVVTLLFLTAGYAYAVSFLRYANAPLYAEVLRKCFGTGIADVLVRMGELYLFPVWGSIVTCLVVTLFSGKLKRMAAFVGQYTLEIYILHTQLFFGVMQKITDLAIIEISLKLVLVTAVCILLAMGVRKIKILRTVLFGYG